MIENIFRRHFITTIKSTANLNSTVDIQWDEKQQETAKQNWEQL